ncbi:MAG: PAS domain S-box protein [Actinomycetota bacterium]
MGRIVRGDERLALHEAEARFRVAFQSAPIGMALCNLEGRYLQVNPALCRLLDRTEDELLSVTWKEITHPDDRQAQAALERAALSGGEPSYQIEKRYLRPDGTEVWTFVARSVVADEEGRPLYLISQVLDLTERKRAEQALRTSEEETRRILETAQDAFVAIDVDGRITDWNRQAERVFGWARDEVLGRLLAETVIPERYRTDHRRGLARFLETGEGPVLGRRLELAALRRDGHEFPVELTIWATSVGPSYRFNALIHDISERVTAEDALRHQAEELGALHETTLDLIRRLEPTSLLETILARAAALLDTEHAYLYTVDEGADELVMRAGMGMFADNVGYRLQRGEGLVGQAWDAAKPMAVDDYQTWPGRLPGFEDIRAAVALPLRAGGDIVGALGLVRQEEGRVFGPDEIDLLSRFGRLASVALDNARLYSAAQQELRERRRAEKELERSAEELRQANEELRAADEMKSNFVAVASHELRTPLTSVLGFATTLLRHWERIPDDERRQQVALIEGQARRLAEMAEELLTMSKLEAGALEVHAGPLDVADAIDQALSSFHDHAGDIEVEDAHGLRAYADPHHVQHILSNYVANALKYGRPPIRVEARERDGWVEVLVSDHGPGVPVHFVPRLFEKFAQAQSSEGGTGLGLSIVRGLARALGGEAWYEPSEPHGAAFGLRLPRA